MAYASRTSIPMNYTYTDAKTGTKYEAHTCTDADMEDRVSGDDLRFKIEDGGDCTVTDANRFTKRILTADSLGAGRI